jgi:hypothetical protein
MTKITKAEQTEAREFLGKLIEPGDTVFTTLKHVSRSGMSRVVDLHVIKDNEPVRISYSAAMLLEGYNQRHEGANVGGCGMDAGFHLVHNLGYRLFPDGFTCVGKRCPSNDHSNGDRDYTPHHHHSGGYALNHRWM